MLIGAVITSAVIVGSLLVALAISVWMQIRANRIEVAWHEAGHALIGIRYGLALLTTTLHRRGGGSTVFAPMRGDTPHRVTMLLAGIATEAIRMQAQAGCTLREAQDRCTTLHLPPGCDVYQAAKLAGASFDLQQELDTAHRAVREVWSSIELVAPMLHAKRSMTAAEVETVLASQ